MEPMYQNAVDRPRQTTPLAMNPILPVREPTPASRPDEPLVEVLDGFYCCASTITRVEFTAHGCGSKPYSVHVYRGDTFTYRNYKTRPEAEKATALAVMLRNQAIAATTAREPVSIGDLKSALLVTYTNHRGETSQRLITPLGDPHWGVTEYHPQPQWLWDVWDHQKQGRRTFAASAVHTRTPLHPMSELFGLYRVCAIRKRDGELEEVPGITWLGLAQSDDDALATAGSCLDLATPHTGAFEFQVTASRHEFDGQIHPNDCIERGWHGLLAAEKSANHCRFCEQHLATSGVLLIPSVDVPEETTDAN